MKKFLVLALLVGVGLTAFAQQTAPNQNGPVLTLEKKTHDFGTIAQGDVVEEVFHFTNTGNEPLIITDARGTCGCTTPKWSREPIPPGGKGEITIGFNSAGKSGRQDKVVTITSNAVNADGTKISFSVQVAPKQNP
jgi:hypothetical protein